MLFDYKESGGVPENNKKTYMVFIDYTSIAASFKKNLIFILIIILLNILYNFFDNVKMWKQQIILS